MSDLDALNEVFRGGAKPAKPKAKSSAAEKRAARAARTRAQALSPSRILFKVLGLPLAVLGMTLSIYVRTSPYERTEALQHLVSLAGCDAAQSVGLAPSFAGEPGYHLRNDPDGDGVACDAHLIAAGPTDNLSLVQETPVQTIDPNIRAGGAKFLRP